jgi:HSP20 family protein
MASDPKGWSPFRELDRFKRDFDELFDRFLGGRVRPADQAAVIPAVESCADEGKFVVRIDLPGIDPKDVEITATGDQLTIRGRRTRNEEEKGRNFTHREVSYGSFERTLKLPEGVKPEELKASYRNGVLELTAPISGDSKTRKVPIEVEAKS